MSNIDKGVILIVDDTLTNLEVLFDCLTRYGFKILVAEDGESAIARAKYALPDLILLDILMPDLDGFETCRRLKAEEKTKEIPIIFMTALTETVDKLKGFNLGAVDYITKPFQQEEVLARVKTHLQLQNLTKQLQEQNQRLEVEIKERQRHEAALAASEERFRLLIEAIKDYAIFMLDPNGRVVTWNTGAQKLKGYSAQEIIGQSFVYFYRDKDIQKGLPERLLETAITLGQVEDEGWRVRKDGSRFWANVVITALWDKEGKLRGFSKVTRDLTTRKQAEDERDRFFKLSLDMLSVSSTDAYFKHINPAFTDTLGYTPEELKSQPFLAFVHPDDQAKTLDEVAKLAEGNVTIDFENRYRCKDGSYRWFCWRAFPIVEEGLIYSIARDVTEHKQAEEERLQLLVQERQARAEAEAARNWSINILESITDAFVTLDKDWRYTYLNPQTEAILKRKREDLLGKNIWDEFPEAIGNTSYREYHRAVTEQVSVEFEDFYPPLNTWFAIHAYPSQEGLSVYFQDVSARKFSEIALRQSEERYQLIVKASNDAVWDWNLVTNEVWWNESVQTLFGYSLEQISANAQWWYDHIHPDDRERVVTGIHRAIDSGEHKWSSEYRYYRADGSYAYVYDRAYILHNSEGKAIRAIGGMTDISDRKQLEEILHNVAAGVAAETGTEFFRSLVRYLAEVLEVEYAFIAEIGAKNIAHTLAVYANGEIVENFEYCIADTPCINLLEEGLCVYPNNVRQKFPNSRFLSEHNIESYIGAPLIDASGKALGFLAVLSRRPVNNSKIAIAALQIFAMRALAELERTIADQKLQRQSQELIRSNSELQQFAYIASHDLQEPLRMVASYLQLLQRRYQNKLDDNANDFIAYAVDGATRMKTLINDLLAYSRVGTHGKAFELTDCNLVVKQAIANLKIAIEEKQATVTWNNLPTITADTTQLIQLFQNLIGNAIKFHGANPTTVHISAVRQEREWLFSVQDNGIGIEPQYTDRIFVVFQRLHSRSEYPGTGIGLAICKKIVERHEGTIWVESKPGLGSTFCFTIPDKDRRSSGF